MSAPRRPGARSSYRQLGGSATAVGQFHSIAACTATEELELGRRIADGDTQALRQMIEANLRLVFAVATRYRCEGIVMRDLKLRHAPSETGPRPIHKGPNGPGVKRRECLQWRVRAHRFSFSAPGEHAGSCPRPRAPCTAAPLAAHDRESVGVAAAKS